MSVYAGADWIKRTFHTEMSPVGEAAANLLGDVFLGIYHLNTTSLLKVNWKDPLNIRVTIPGELATYDDSALSRLVFLAHDRALRVAVDARSFGYLRVTISQRDHAREEFWARHPTLEEHIQQIRDHYRVDALGTRP